MSFFDDLVRTVGDGLYNAGKAVKNGMPLTVESFLFPPQINDPGNVWVQAQQTKDTTEEYRATIDELATENINKTILWGAGICFGVYLLTE